MHKKTKLSEITHEAMVRNELERFRHEVEEKYSQSKVNQSYTFPRKNEYKDKTDLNATLSCNISLNIVAVIPVNTKNNGGKQKNNINDKSDYFATYSNKKINKEGKENKKPNVCI